MRKNLKESSKDYTLKCENGIHPISILDAEIVDTLLKCVKTFKGTKVLVEIMNNYKDLPDSDMIDNLLHFVESREIVDENSDIIDFLRIEDRVFQVRFILSIEKDERPIDAEISMNALDTYLDEKNLEDVELYEYLIYINRNVEGGERTPLRDIKISFQSEKERDSEFEKIQDKMKEFTKVRFL